MKKLFILALVMLSTSVVFAADSEPLKAILKAKTYQEAAELIQQNLAQLAGNEEKAKAYNKLLDLASDKFEKEIFTITENEAAKQLGKGKVEPYDTVGFYEAAYTGVQAALECDKYDVMPNEKGKVKPKFRALNEPRLERIRMQLLNGGNWALEKEQSAKVLKYWGAYINSSVAPIRKESANPQPDMYVGQVAALAARFAYQEGDYTAANNFINVALEDPDQYAQAVLIKLAISEKMLKTHEDSLNYVKEIEALYKQKSSDELFSLLVTFYTNLGDKAKAASMVEEKLVADPANKAAWALKGQNALFENDYQTAIDAFRKADLNNVGVLTYLGFALNAKANDIQENAERRKLFKESEEYLEKARDLDPDHIKANWTYPLRLCYYNLYGENDARYKEIDKMIGQ